MKSPWVVAWYCETKAAAADAGASLRNIGKQCVINSVNTCLNEQALVKHNEYRMQHATPPLKYDAEVARDLQKEMDSRLADVEDTDAESIT